MKPAPPVINILCILTNLFFRNPSTLRSHPAKTGETSDGPLTLERSGSEHAKSVRLHPRFLRKRGLGRKWSSLWKGRRRDLKKFNIQDSLSKKFHSHREWKGDICHSHSSALAEHSHATYHYLSILGDKQYLPSKLPSSPGASPRLR